MRTNKTIYSRLRLLLLLFITTTGAYAQTSDSLATYIAAAIRNNPAVISGYNAYKAQVMSACGAGSLNDPTIQVGVYPKSMQHVNGKQIATFTIM